MTDRTHSHKRVADAAHEYARSKTINMGWHRILAMEFTREAVRRIVEAGEFSEGDVWSTFEAVERDSGFRETRKMFPQYGRAPRE